MTTQLEKKRGFRKEGLVAIHGNTSKKWARKIGTTPGKTMGDVGWNL